MSVVERAFGGSKRGVSDHFLLNYQRALCACAKHAASTVPGVDELPEHIQSAIKVLAADEAEALGRQDAHDEVGGAGADIVTSLGGRRHADDDWGLFASRELPVDQDDMDDRTPLLNLRRTT
jgi:hypothetical protein